MVVFIDRMTLLGLEDRFFSKEKRPLLNEYSHRIGERKSVQMLRADVKKMIPIMIWSMFIKKAIPYVAAATVIGLAVGAGIWFLKNKK